MSQYGGVLASISAETSSLVLKDVQVYGTESRVSGPGSVPAETSPRPSMEFKGSDVSDLQVLESESQPPAATSESSSGSPTQQQTNNEKSNDAKNDNDDDFYSRTQRLSESHPETEVHATKAYEKSSSFFDNLGGPSQPRGKEFRDQEKSMNLETFGETGYHGNNRHGTRGRGGHRGRGGRGGRRGGRGGLHGRNASHRDSDSENQGASQSSQASTDSREASNRDPSHRDQHSKEHRQPRERQQQQRGDQGNRPRQNPRSKEESDDGFKAAGQRPRRGNNGGKNQPRNGKGNGNQQITEFVPGGQFA